jgi:apolipoprotein D and lipocalin family protein
VTPQAKGERLVKSHTAYTGRTLGVPQRVAGFLLVLSLAACGQHPPRGDIPLRNPTAAFGGTSRFDAARFAGDWATVACLGDCAPQVRYAQTTGGDYLRQAGGTTTAYAISAPGILRQRDADRTLVVMWVDEGFRTAVVGDADGRWAAILNRDRRPAPDRIMAAREILDFNGWDVSKLRKIDG